MQDNTSEASTSITQLLRESYLAENSHQGNSERSRSEPSPHSFHCGDTSGTSDEVPGQDELPDLSAFLSQEELDQSVNLARQAISQDPLESKPDEQIHVFYPSELKNSGNTVSNKPQFQPASSPTLDSSLKKQPLGSEAESKKEFLNKAADFIEELSSLFKAHNSKRIRPRTCKNYKSKLESKNKAAQESSCVFSNLSESRERPCVPVPQDLDKTEHTLEHPDNLQQTDLEAVNALEISGLTTDSSAASFDSEEPIGQPPHFTQKLKSREVPEGTKVQLDCIVVGIPTPEIRWYCEGKELENSPDIQITQSGDLHSLIIVDAFEEDTGRYSCFASNIYGTDSTSAEIYVEGASSSESETDTSKEEMDQYQNHTKISSVVPPPPVNTTITHQESPKPQPSMIHPVSIPVLHSQSPTNYLQGLDGRPIIAAPVFTKMLQNISASEGQLVVFECRVKGAPSPKVEWYREGTLIEDSPDFRILQKKPRSMSEPEEICTLVIAEVFSEDSGSFTCTASNKYGTVSSSAHLAVKGPEDQNNNAALHSVSSISLVATEQPHPSLVPSLPLVDQLPKPKLEGVLINHNEPRSSSKAGLHVHFKLPEDDKGSEASSEDGGGPGNQIRPNSFSDKMNGQIFKIQEPTSPSKEPPPVLAKPKLGNQGTVKKNPRTSQLATEDSIRDHKAAVVKDLEKRLHLRDDIFPQSQQRTTYDENLARKLQGPSNDTPAFNFTAQDVSKEYKISSFEQRLMNEIEFRLERTPVDESDDEIQHDEIPTGKCIAPIFDKRLKHFRVLEGYPATFTCKIVGIPVPKVYWFKDGKQISKKNEHFKMSREGDGTCSLYIESTTNDDDGNYTIMAANPQGRISCSGHLMVQTPPLRSRLTAAVQTHRGRSRVPEGDKEPLQERFFRPYFLQAPGDMVAHEGRLCRLDCKVSGLPPPELMWLRNGKPVLPDATHKMLVRETGVHSLLIDPLTQNDAGTYTCIATNKTGQNSFSLELSVVAKEVKKAPVILEKLQNCGIPEGHPVRLECRVIGMPPPVFYWKKDNETIPPYRERMSMHQDATGYVCLLIQPAKKVDAGWYTLSAKNEAGIVSCTARLDIYAQWHQQIPQPIKIRPGGTRYGSLSGQGLDIFSAFSAVENPVKFSSPSQPVVESEEL
ncbi:myopalladin isoform X3 [Sceloporus undulatus]|uniref:myopalladin isoform X3 n=1 Tax=Sceloporus undulatus TaxID=8520 RepID=UPI001C4ACE56|nr:myopalladin isoform X3 [Sceloporus undulatus]